MTGTRRGPVEEVLLSNRGRLWSYTDSRYTPPPPFVPLLLIFIEPFDTIVKLPFDVLRNPTLFVRKILRRLRRAG